MRTVLAAAVAMFIVTGCSSSDSTSTTTPEGFLRPQANDDGGTFWATGFGLIIPAGAWEPNERNPKRCQLVDGEEGWHVVTDTGRDVALPNSEPTVQIDTASSKVAAPVSDPDNPACWVRGSVLGDFDDLGQSYTVTNERLTATFTAAEFFDGQDGTRNVYKQLQAI